MKNTVLLWVLAFIITAMSAYYQRVTGPTYALSGKVMFDGKEIRYKLVRSHWSEQDAPVMIETNDPEIMGFVDWKRYKTDDAWTRIQMFFRKGWLTAMLPRQLPAGKLMYTVTLQKGESKVTIAEKDPAIIRYKADVPTGVLIIHVIAMFGAMFLSTRTGLEFFRKEAKLKNLVLWTLGFLLVGGFILGPIVQKYAFNAYWTGWPFGNDLTDNKTALAFLAWLVVLLVHKKVKHPSRWALGAAIITTAVYLIPHSVLGSELNYKEMDKQQKIEMKQ
jgi:hypothetical protein